MVLVPNKPQSARKLWVNEWAGTSCNQARDGVPVCIGINYLFTPMADIHPLCCLFKQGATVGVTDIAAVC